MPKPARSPPASSKGQSPDAAGVERTEAALKHSYDTTLNSLVARSEAVGAKVRQRHQRRLAEIEHLPILRASSFRSGWKCSIARHSAGVALRLHRRGPAVRDDRPPLQQPRRLALRLG